MKIYNDEQLRSMRSQGMTYPEIAQALGTKTKYIKNACIRRGIGYTEEERQKAVEKGKDHHIILPDDEWEEKVEEKSQGRFKFVCVEGRKNRESQIRVRCKSCQFEKIVSAISLRHKDKQMKCPECERKNRSLKEANEQAEHMNTRIRLSGSMKGQMGLRFCECGAVIPQLMHRRKCDKCIKEAQRECRRRREHKKRFQTLGGDLISLKELYKRDKGICYLCGCECDWNDCIRYETGQITGPTYPSIDHVIPRAKGGKHIWGNVRLACFINSRIPP